MDQGPRSWHIDEAGGKVGKTRLTQRHRALQHVGITLIPAYSPEARGRSECAFQTLLDRLPNELALRLDHGEGGGQPQPGEQFLPTYNRRFGCQFPKLGRPSSPGSARTSPKSCVSMRSKS
jgi:hypothetical protein